ncbi:hypothetical protein CPJCM30710_02090 [Clostridium polyendosporum]|uniref:Restriction endonuclease n=1 Tax=Clostridium polyendosporum TaxID=69208 RepID=A0A919VKE5_9CLOT|nr:hypothetical protein [Clostridium polyendosporum]GIM27543.1 hypothetical protein CPJCM30710_02090 [Clostridium polyendosporum]
MFTRTIIGIFVILCSFQVFSLIKKVIYFILFIKDRVSENTLASELDNLTKCEFTEWCMEYVKSKGYKEIEKVGEDNFKCTLQEKIYFVYCFRREELDENWIYKINGLKYIKSIENMLIITTHLTNEEEKNTFLKLKENGISVLDRYTFNMTYEEFIRNKVYVINN